MNIDDDNPLLDSRWVRQIGDAMADRLLGPEAVRIDRETTQRHKELITVHREGWKHVATAIEGGFRVLADAIREHGRR